MTAYQDNRPYIVGIGASAGGHEALCEFFSHLPPSLSAGFVVVTHLLRGFKSELPHIISRYTFMNVLRIKGGEMVKPGNVYVLPENMKATLHHGQLVLNPRPESEKINSSVNDFFISLAEDQREKAVGIVLSGMGTDGAKGCVAIHENGGMVMVQDPASTKFNSMPIAVIREDHPQGILDPKQLGDYLLHLIASREFQEK